MCVNERASLQGDTEDTRECQCPPGRLQGPVPRRGIHTTARTTANAIVRAVTGDGVAGEGCPLGGPQGESPGPILSTLHSGLQGLGGVGQRWDTLVIDAVQRETGVGEPGKAVPVKPGPQRDVLWQERARQRREGMWLLQLLNPLLSQAPRFPGGGRHRRMNKTPSAPQLPGHPQPVCDV